MKKVEVTSHLNDEFAKGETRVTGDSHAKLLANQGFVKILGDATPEDIKADEDAQEKKTRAALGIEPPAKAGKSK